MSKPIEMKLSKVMEEELGKLSTSDRRLIIDFASLTVMLGTAQLMHEQKLMMQHVLVDILRIGTCKELINASLTAENLNSFLEKWKKMEKMAMALVNELRESVHDHLGNIG